MELGNRGLSLARPPKLETYDEANGNTTLPLRNGSEPGSPASKPSLAPQLDQAVLHFQALAPR